MFFYLARRYLFRGKAKHISFIGIVSCVGIALGVGTLIIVISVMNGFDRDLMARLLRFNYHVTVESVDKETLFKAKEHIAQWPEARDVSLFAQTQVFARFDDYVLPLFVKGIDFTDAREKKNFNQYVVKHVSAGGFFVGERLKKRFYLKDTIAYYPLEKKMKLQTSPIAGFFKTGLYDVDNNFMIGDLTSVQALSGHYFLQLGVNTLDPFAADKLRDKIMQTFPQGVFAHTWMESNQTLFSALRLEKITMFIILSLIIIVASFNIFATLTVKVVEKTKDIGVLKSLGFTEKTIMGIFSMQGLLLGFMGVFSGVLFGLGLCLILQKYPFIRLPEEIYVVEYLPVALNYRDILLIVVLGILISFLSSVIPARRAARLSACEALRYE